MKTFFIALQFLTSIPIPWLKQPKDKSLGKSCMWFPVIGLLIGLVLAVAYIIGNLFLPRLIVSALVIAAMVVITGGLHLDGLADTIDGFNGGKDKAHILKIMHDENIGAMAVLGIVVVLLLKFTAVSCLSFKMAANALIATSVLSRWAMAFSCWKFPAAGNPKSLGRRFIDNVNFKHILLATMLMLAILLPLLGSRGLWLFLISSLIIFFFNFYSTKKIGGLTGDTLGALGELVEMVTLVGFFVIF